MYAKFINNTEFENISRPNWFMDDGTPVTDEILKQEGILPIIDDYPEDVDPIAQIVNENAQSDWVINENNVTRTYSVTNLTIEEQRARYPRLGMVEFRRKLRSTKVVARKDLNGEDYLDGIFEEDILEKIDMIGDRELAAEARDYFLYAQYIERSNPWVDILGAMFDITPEEIDVLWLNE